MCQFELTKLHTSIPSGIICAQTFGVTVHHMMRRGKNLNDTRFFMTLCPTHHDWVENNKRKAREMGYILYK